MRPYTSGGGPASTQIRTQLALPLKKPRERSPWYCPQFQSSIKEQSHIKASALQQYWCVSAHVLTDRYLDTKKISSN